MGPAILRAFSPASQSILILQGLAFFQIQFASAEDLAA